MPSWSKIWQDDLLIASSLSATAGFADAVGYLKSGVFAANMTGNTVLAGISLAEAKWDVALQRGMTLAAFCVGVVGASLMLRLWRDRSAAALIVEAALVLASALAEPRVDLSIALIAAAMGVQAVAVTRFRSIVASTVVVTTTMARLSEFGLAWCVARPEARAAAPKIAPSLLGAIWLFYALGAITAVFVAKATAQPLFVPSFVLVLVALALALQNART